MNNRIELIVSSQIEHHAVLNPINRIEKTGIETHYLPVNCDCIISLESIKKVLSGKKTFASIMYQNNETGVIQSIKDFARLIHNDNEQSIVHTDAVQAVGHTKINVKDIDVDMLSASAHKFNGPKGVGFLYVKNSLNITPYILGGGQEEGMRSGTENVAEIFSMAKALEENINCIDKTNQHINLLERLLIKSLKEKKIPFLINGNVKSRANGLLNISIKDVDGEGLLNMLDTHSICISTGSACNASVKEQSYVLTSMNLGKERIDSAVRISIGRYNTEHDVIELVNRISQYYLLINKVSK